MCIRDKDIGALWRIMNVDYNMTLRIHNIYFFIFSLNFHNHPRISKQTVVGQETSNTNKTGWVEDGSSIVDQEQN